MKGKSPTNRPVLQIVFTQSKKLNIFDFFELVAACNGDAVFGGVDNVEDDEFSLFFLLTFHISRRNLMALPNRTINCN